MWQLENDTELSVVLLKPTKVRPQRSPVPQTPGVDQTLRRTYGQDIRT